MIMVFLSAAWHNFGSSRIYMYYYSNTEEGLLAISQADFTQKIVLNYTKIAIKRGKLLQK